MTPEALENINIINRSGEHLLTLINQILDLSKIEAGRMILNENNFDLYRLLNDLEDMFSLKAEEKGLNLVLEIDENVPQYIRADEVKLRQVLINLLSNAIKFTIRGTVTFRVKFEAESQTFPDLPVLLSLEVEDTGPGIPSDELKHLFEAFVQTQTGLNSQEGTGLGLPISRKFVELMGGHLQVISQVNHGSLFKFDIQISVVNSEEIYGKRTLQRVIGLEPNQPDYRILIVDDKQTNRQLLVKLLSPLGFQVKEAGNGQEAVEIWDVWEPHLIWMDMRMPVRDGYQATQEIKATIKGQATAIIAITASVLEEEKAVVLSAGCDDFIRKPFREEEIFGAMANHLGVRYIYENLSNLEASSIFAQEQQELTPRVISALPPEWVANLEQAILQGDLQLMSGVIEQIQSQNSYLANALNHHLENFEYDKILNLIRL